MTRVSSFHTPGTVESYGVGELRSHGVMNSDTLELMELSTLIEGGISC